MRWQRLKSWVIRKLGGHVESPAAPRTLYLRHEQPTYMPPDRPFDPIDWERLTTLPRREGVFFEWVGHRIRHLDAQATRYKTGPEGDRDRLVYLARRDECLRTLEVGREAAEKLVRLLKQKEKAERVQQMQKGMNNHGG